MRAITLLALFGIITRQPLCAHGLAPHAANINSDRAALAASALRSWYDPNTGLYKSTGWWNSANAITALADESRISGSKLDWPIFANTRSAAQKTSPEFLNNFYDDEGWWAMAWIDVYSLTHDRRYLAIARSIFADMSGGWDSACGGGIWWSKDRKYKNAIANELFLDVAASLAENSSGAERRRYLQWADKEWHWFAASGMINAHHLVNDGLNGSCANNGKTEWSYNQGVLLGGLAALSQACSDRALLLRAYEIANAAISSLTDANGILHDPCEPNCGADGTQFKGIFLRNLRILNDVDPSPRFVRFATTNADSVWAQAQSTANRFGPVWCAAYGTPDASTQSSALDLFVAAAEMSSPTHPTAKTAKP